MNGVNNFHHDILYTSPHVKRRMEEGEKVTQGGGEPIEPQPRPHVFLFRVKGKVENEIETGED
jgi:hypothetical protein